MDGRKSSRNQSLGRGRLLLSSAKAALELQLQRDQKGKHQAHMDRGLGWKQDIYPINKPTFSGQLGLNPNLEIVEISLVDLLTIFFDNGIFGEIQSETNRHTKRNLKK